MFDVKGFSDILKKITDTYTSISEFAEKSEVNRTYLSKYINMKLNNPPTPKILKKLAEASNGLTSYAELMLICDYLHDDFDELLGDSFTIYNNPYSSNLKYNGSEIFIFDIIYSFENLNNLDYTEKEKKHITKVYNYISNNNDYKKIINEFHKLKNEYNSKHLKIELNEMEIAFASGIKGLNKENQEIAKNIIEGLLAKQKNEENKKEK